MGWTGELSRSAVAFMIASAFFFSLMSALVKGLDRLPTSEVILARTLISLVMTGIAIRRAGICPWGTARSRLILRGLFGFFGLCCFYAAIARLDLSDATVLHYLNPIFTAVFAAVFLREGLRRAHAAVLVISFLGVLFVARPSLLFGGSSLPIVGVLLGLGGAFFSAAAYTMIRSLRTEHSLVVVLYFPLVTLPIAVPWAVFDFVMPTGSEWWLLLGGGVTTQCAQVALTRGLSICPAGPAMNLAYSQVLFALILQALIFGVVPSGLGLIGATFIFCAVVLLSIMGRSLERRDEVADRGCVSPDGG